MKKNRIRLSITPKFTHYNINQQGLPRKIKMGRKNQLGMTIAVGGHD